MVCWHHEPGAFRLCWSSLQLANLATMHHDSLVPREWFGKASMQRINVLSIQRISARPPAPISMCDLSSVFAHARRRLNAGRGRERRGFKADGGRNRCAEKKYWG